MLNEDKIKLMTSIAMFEKKEGKAIFPAQRYFASDYISSRMLRAFFSYTFCYGLCMLLWALYNMEKFLNTMNLDEVVESVRVTGILYVVGLVFYLIVAFVVYQRRYEYAKGDLKVYVAKLKRLEKRYEFQSRTKELTKEGGHYDDVSRT